MINLFLAFIVFLLPQDPAKTLELIKEKYAGLTSLQAEFYQGSGVSGKDVKGVLYYSKRNKFRVEYSNKVLVSNGETIWNYEKELNRVLINSVNNAPSVFSLEEFLDELSYNSLIADAGTDDGLSGLKIEPLQSESGFSKVFLWADKDMIVRRVKIFDLMGNTFDLRMRNIKLNPVLQTEIFIFKPVKGVEIIDFR